MNTQTDTTSSYTMGSGAAQTGCDLPATILLVDDEPALLEPVATVLRRQGFSVLAASDAITAMNHIRVHGQNLSLLILDATLFGFSSSEVLAEARRNRPGLPVIVTSAYWEQWLDSFCAGTQIDCFLVKPFRMGTLLNHVGPLIAKD